MESGASTGATATGLSRARRSWWRAPTRRSSWTTRTSSPRPGSAGSTTTGSSPFGLRHRSWSTTGTWRASSGCPSPGAVSISTAALHLRRDVREVYLDRLARTHPQLAEETAVKYAAHTCSRPSNASCRAGAPAGGWGPGRAMAVPPSATIDSCRSACDAVAITGGRGPPGAWEPSSYHAPEDAHLRRGPEGMSDVTGRRSEQRP